MSKPNSNPNTNCLAGMSCPKCGDFGPFEIFASQSGMVRVADDGTDFIDGNVDWEDDAACECLACGHKATVAEFSGEPAPVPDEFQRQVLENYAQGDYADFTLAEAAHSGDSLLTFLLSELSVKEDCTSAEVAIERLETVLEDIEELRAVFQAKL